MAIKSPLLYCPQQKDVIWLCVLTRIYVFVKTEFLPKKLIELLTALAFQHLKKKKKTNKLTPNE